jgi:hypothetical protein
MAASCANLREAVKEQVFALILAAPEGFVAAWEELEAEKVGGLRTRDATAVCKYKHRVAEIKRALRTHPALAAQVVAGEVTPTALADASGDALVAAVEASEATNAAEKESLRAADVAASRRFQLQYLRQLTARSPGDVDYSDSESEGGKTARRDSIKSRRQSRKSARDSFDRRLSLQSEQSSPGAQKKLRKRASGASRGRRGSDASRKATPNTAKRIQAIKARIGSPPVFAPPPELRGPKRQEARSAVDTSRAGYGPVKYKASSKATKERKGDAEPSTPRVQKKVQKISREKSAHPHKRAARGGVAPKQG